MIKMRDLLEGKSIGIIYHYTELGNLKAILNDNCVLKAGRRTNGEYISFSRFGASLPDYISHFGSCRFVVDGTKLSNKFKIVPDSKYRTQTIDDFTGEITPSEWKNKPFEKKQGEERYYGKSLNIKPYLLKIQILKKEFIQNGWEVGFENEEDLKQFESEFSVKIELIDSWKNK